MENTKYGKRREERWTPIRAKAQDTRANPNSWDAHLVGKRWDIGLLRALSLWIIMMITHNHGERVPKVRRESEIAQFWCTGSQWKDSYTITHGCSCSYLNALAMSLSRKS